MTSCIERENSLIGRIGGNEKPYKCGIVFCHVCSGLYSV